MNNQLLKKALRGLVAALFVTTIVAQAQAGPAPQMYVPVRTAKQAESIKPGERLAITCGNCGAVSVFTAGSDRSYLRGFTCSGCKRKFVTHEIGGRGASVGTFVYEDSTGHQAHLLHAM